MNLIFITILIFLLVIPVLILIKTGHIKFNFSNKKWKCTEQGCEQNMSGEYTSKEDCEKHCDETENNKTSLAELNLDNQQKEINNAWACTQNYNCIKAEQGYTSKELCEENCKKPQYQNYYYPQSMIPYYYYRAPYINFKPRWRHRRHHRPHHHKKQN
jgi:hypothetical protein